MQRAVFIILIFLTHQLCFSQVCINEILSSNTSGILDEDQEYADWIEIYNTSDSPFNLTGFGLSDDKAMPDKWTFPVMMLPPHEHVLVFASAKNRKSIPMTFQTIIDVGREWHYLVPDSDIGPEWHNNGYNDSTWLTGNSSFGYADNDDTTLIPSTSLCVFIRKEFSVADIADIGRLILSIDYDDGFVAYINGKEVARSNLGAPGEYIAFDRVADTYREATMYTGGTPEYFEIENPAAILNAGVNVIAIQVHNNAPGSSDLSLIPFLTTGRFTEGTDDISPFLSFSDFGGLHTNFKIDSDSESVYLFNKTGTLLDSAGGVAMMSDVSFGRKSDASASWTFMGFPTPGAANSCYSSGTVSAPAVVLEPKGGKISTSVSVSMTTGTAGDSIYYSTDGSIPDISDLRYTGPFMVSSNTVIRARAIRYNMLPGPVSTTTYVTGKNHDIPIVCLSTDPPNLWDDNFGIYAFGTEPRGDVPYFNANFWKDWERPVHIELYDTQGNRQIDQDAGTKIYGNWTRASDQKSMALYARKSYGKGSFQYKLFADKPVDKFESFILRNSGNDNMGLQFHDCFMTGLTRNMDIDRQSYQPAAVYINGQYWGLLNIREKISVDYIAENQHVKADSVNLLEGWGNPLDGTNEGFMTLTNYVDVKTTLQNDADYGPVRAAIDADNFIKYQLTEIYLNNRDWPGNNIKFWNTSTPGSQWRWILYDTDFGYGIWDVNDYMVNTLDFALEVNGPAWPNPPWSTLLLRRLVTNIEFRNSFIIQFCDRLNLDFKASRAIADLDSLKILYDNEIVYNFSRWWGSYSEWTGRISNRKTFAQQRPAYCRQFLKSRFSLGSELNVTLDVSGTAEGYIKLNTIYPDSYPFSGIYFKNLPIELKAIPKPGYRFVRWEGSVISEEPVISYNMAVAGNFIAVFAEAGAKDVSVVINEINYASSPSHDTKDWVELLNNSITSVDLSGWTLLDSGVDSGFVFAQGTILGPGDYIVVCRDLTDFRSYNPLVSNSVGDLEFKLAAEGEIIRLFDENNVLVDAVNYGIVSPWPVSANGSGQTIELKHPSMDNSLGENWQAGVNKGTPGAQNSVYTIPTRIRNTITDANALECFPNPFRDYTTISFHVEAPGEYRLEVVDMQGRTVKILSADFLNTGDYWIDWTGDNAENGVYTIRLTGARVYETRKLVKQ